jgi:hypothetical protein
MVKGTVSYFVGKTLFESTGMWGLFTEENRPCAICIDPTQFDEYLRGRERLQRDLDRYVESLGLPTLSLYYEDLLLHKDDILKQIFTWFKVKPLPIKSDTLKITSDDLRDAISNYDELKANYSGTPYEYMFDEILVPSH